jgi:CyaY protein
MNNASQLAESEFHRRVDAVLSAIERAVDESGADIDTELTGGILTLSFQNGSKIIVNRQTPNREIWVAAKSGGYHFRFDGAQWVDTRGGDGLDALLVRVIGEQSGDVMSITL